MLLHCCQRGLPKLPRRNGSKSAVRPVFTYIFLVSRSRKLHWLAQSIARAVVVVGPAEKQTPRAIESAYRAFRLTIGGDDESACQIHGTGAEAQPCEIIWIFFVGCVVRARFRVDRGLRTRWHQNPVNTAPTIGRGAPEGTRYSAKLREWFHARKLGDIEAAWKFLEDAARDGNVGAASELGRIYDDGDGVEPNHQLAFECFIGIADSHVDELTDTAEPRFVANSFVTLAGYYLTGIRVFKENGRSEKHICSWTGRPSERKVIPGYQGPDTDIIPKLRRDWHLREGTYVSGFLNLSRYAPGTAAECLPRRRDADDNTL
jgi:hypothetical protein